ncbi:HSPB1-associated protein 1 [Scaptodrosophila lebanonensis]|uniref:HSPB1-associated protein 1 n=1 Tax=Drosophila lebanonensis TaxID=7225 RepID=A0A6J2T2D2_DROLE|nr:HSPB1-associated protein 1 [Scaptodrosophila lebanonensis]
MPDSDRKVDDLTTKLRHIILNTRVPLVLPGFQTNWTCFSGTLSNWCEIFDRKANCLPIFERMLLSDSNTPQWERKRTQLGMTTKNFLQHHHMTQPYWTAYHYKRAEELPAACKEGIDFGCFGFEEHGNDYTFWLGSQGANTPCHYDTFGVNIVVQVYGSKSWLLFPPDTPLKSTRIPYEESSVYCRENFFAPAPKELASLEKYQSQAYHCVLAAGDVLIVPRHWWHYAEALETSLSVNYWVPLKRDLDIAFEELIVKHMVESFAKNESEEVKRYLLNPNQLEEIVLKPTDLFDQFERAIKSAESTESKRNHWNNEYLSQEEVNQLLNCLELQVHPLQIMSQDAYTHLLTTNALRHTSSPTESQVLSPTLELLINSMCAPVSISSIKREFFQRLGEGRL